MRLYASLLVGLPCVFASRAPTQTQEDMLHVVDYRTLKTCYSASDCLPWQVCASCMHSHLSIVAKYCSDSTYRGICGYRDEDFFCSCDEYSSDKPQAQREGRQKLMNTVTGQGQCIVDNDCHNYSSGKEARCVTCMEQSARTVDNICVDIEKTDLFCSSSGSFSALCSCGQIYPLPKLIWPLQERDRFINEQKRLGNLKVGDAGNYLAQPVAAATPEMDSTEFEDHTADSVQAEMIPGDDDWTV